MIDNTTESEQEYRRILNNHAHALLSTQEAVEALKSIANASETPQCPKSELMRLVRLQRVTNKICDGLGDFKCVDVTKVIDLDGDFFFQVYISGAKENSKLEKFIQKELRRETGQTVYVHTRF